jgi:hypothetical protein
MPSKELKQAWLIVHASITGAVFGIGLNNLYTNFSWGLLAIDFVVLWIIVYILTLAIKHNS